MENIPLQKWLKFLQNIASKCKMWRRGYLAVYLTIAEATQTCILNIIKDRLYPDRKMTNRQLRPTNAFGGFLASARAAISPK
ncbi:hypothetical protein HFN20_15710 [Paenibacillus dendritiformis]|uniref:hypothetical protein n=1 Tax=Paenibacillus dendritiformis TaxID=130049 RepID=UPI00143D9E0A|nr:hypothetical protein [Paenibacillus dendritiformis]NKI22647.1 hypothetical protein [Paenibacillus dendritiformis]NRF96633.1 hypothetical protein [Paenibacillus dendritiformis]